jgi:hypothetical protein
VGHESDTRSLFVAGQHHEPAAALKAPGDKLADAATLAIASSSASIKSRDDDAIGP